MIVSEKDQIKPKSFKIVKCEPSHGSIRHGMKKKDFPLSFSSWEKLDRFLFFFFLLLKNPKKFITFFIEIGFRESFPNKFSYRVKQGSHKKINLRKQMLICHDQCGL